MGGGWWWCALLLCAVHCAQLQVKYCCFLLSVQLELCVVPAARYFENINPIDCILSQIFDSLHDFSFVRGLFGSTLHTSYYCLGVRP